MTAQLQYLFIPNDWFMLGRLDYVSVFCEKSIKRQAVTVKMICDRLLTMVTLSIGVLIIRMRDNTVVVKTFVYVFIEISKWQTILLRSKYDHCGVALGLLVRYIGNMGFFAFVCGIK